MDNQNLEDGEYVQRHAHQVQETVEDVLHNFK
jgi:hypothetical protein